MQSKPRRGALELFSLLAFAGFLALGVVPAAHAATITVNSTWCMGFGFSWNSGTSTCTLTGTYPIASGNTLVIPSGATLLITSTGDITIESGGSLTVDSGGVINLENSAFNTAGIANFGGTITVNGVINAENSGTDTEGIFLDGGSMSVYGTLNVEPLGGNVGVYNMGGTITKECSGTITGTIAGSPTGGYTSASGCTTASGVPEFPLGIALLFAALIPLLLILRKFTPKGPGISV
jgi:hypothetical protein